MTLNNELFCGFHITVHPFRIRSPKKQVILKAFRVRRAMLDPIVATYFETQFSILNETEYGRKSFTSQYLHS